MAERLLKTAHFWATQKQMPVRELYEALDGVEPDGARGKKQPTYYLSTVDAALLARAEDSGLDLNAERARLAKWQADRTEQEVELRARRMLDANEVTEWVAGMIATVKARLVQIPDAVAQFVDHEHGTAVAEDVRRLIYEALEELATERGGGAVAVDDSVAAAAAPDGKPVGGSVPSSVKRVKRRARKMED